MAEEQPAWFFHEDDNEHPGELVRRATISSWCATEGIIQGLALSANGTPNNTVKVAAGECVVQGDTGSDQGMYYCHNDAQVSLTAANNAGASRTDLVVAEVLDSEYGDAASGAALWRLRLVQGTSGAGTPATPDNCLVLGRITVGTGSPPTITTGNISSLLPRSYPRHAEVLMQAGTVPSAAGQSGFGPFTLLTTSVTWPKAPRYVRLVANLYVGSNTTSVAFPRADEYLAYWARTAPSALTLYGNTYRTVYAKGAYGVGNNPESLRVEAYSDAEAAGAATYTLKVQTDYAGIWDANADATAQYQIWAVFA